jgi:hypothetical protein
LISFDGVLTSVGMSKHVDMAQMGFDGSLGEEPLRISGTEV